MSNAFGEIDNLEHFVLGLRTVVPPRLVRTDSKSENGEDAIAREIIMHLRLNDLASLTLGDSSA